ncbi:MAG: hypothetical protein K8R21_13130 [Leptospira sp.]|nr:hypothetical protein [Leptospira sp.]
MKPFYKNPVQILFSIVTLIFLTLLQNCKLNFDNPNEQGSRSFYAISILSCLLGQDSVFCPKITVNGNIQTNLGTSVQSATVTISPSIGVTVTPSTNSSGNFSTILISNSFNVSIKGFNKVTIGSFGVVGLSDTTVSITNISSGLTVTPAVSKGRIILNIQIFENSFYSYFGGVNNESGRSVTQTSDGGYIIAGSVPTSGFSFTGMNPIIPFSQTADSALIKITNSGVVQWFTFLGGLRNNGIFSVVQTTDEGYVVVGSSDNTTLTTIGGKTSIYPYAAGGQTQPLAIKLNSTGNVEWFTFLGNTSTNDQVDTVIQTADGGYLMAGYSLAAMTNFGSKSPVNAYNLAADPYVVKLKANGTLDWYTFLGGANADQADALFQTKDGGYIVAGRSQGFATLQGISPLNAYSTFSDDFLIVKLNSSGSTDWFTFIGGNGSDYAQAISEDSNGDLLIFGQSASSGLVVSGKAPINQYQAGNDMYGVKISSSGQVLWHTFLGSTGTDVGFGSGATSDGGFIVTGYAGSGATNYGINPLNSYKGGNDFSVIRLNSAGSILWHTFLGSTGTDQPGSILQTIDGGFMVGGFGDSITGLNGKSPVNSFGGGTSDFLLFKLKADGNL